MSESEREKLAQLVLMARGIMFGIFMVVLFGVLFVIHVQLDRIEYNIAVNDGYRSTVQALEIGE